MTPSQVRPRVLFHYPIFNAGGAEMSVLRLTKFLAENGWDVELVLTTGGGELESRIDSRVKVIRLRQKSYGTRYFSERNPVRRLGLLMSDGIPYALSRVQQKLRTLQFRTKKYDAAIISLHGLSPDFCFEKVNARRRIQWIRNDLSRCDPDHKAGRNIEKYGTRMDAYACVSRSSFESLVTLYPQTKDRAVVLYNILDTKTMRALGDELPNPYADYGDGLKIVTVCRLADKAKGLFRMLAVHQRLRAEGIDYIWFIIGDGPDRAALSEAVATAGVQHSFVLLGHQSNPFPYYKHADISATLSNYEGLCGSVNEAKTMGKPIIATQFSGIEEQLTSGVNGLIVDNNEDAILVGMRQIINNETLRASITNDTLPPAIADDEYKLRLLTDLVMGEKRVPE